MDEESRREAVKLYDVMNQIGVNEQMRRLDRQVGIHHEIMDTVTNHMEGRNISTYRFGSSCEGTTTPGTESDVDVVSCDEGYPVIQDIQQAPPGMAFLMVADRDTRPGYVKLQVVDNGTPLTLHFCDITDHSILLYDSQGRVCHKHYSGTWWLKDFFERNGPADTVNKLPFYSEVDRVSAYRSRACPPAAVESLLECARTGWLTSDDVNKMADFGCMFVGVGHPASDEKDIEWRVSFSLQERQLMFKLNPVQHVCYVLLKIIKNMITSEPDVGKSITSYHMKTCMLSVATKTRLRWTPENLIKCTFTCLQELLQCLYTGNLPNFFIKRNNMFERRVHGPVRERVIAHLQQILHEGYRVFYRIQSDSIGELLSGNTDRYISVAWQRGMRMESACNTLCLCLLHQQAKICKHLTKLSNNDSSLFLCQQLCYLESIYTITEHSQEETKAAVRTLESILHQLYAQHLASLAFSTDVHETRHRLLQESANHIRQGMTWNLMSGKLVSATILYRLGNNEMCRDFLELLEKSLSEEVQSVCGCHDSLHFGDWNLVLRIMSGNTDPQSIRESYMAACTIFLPAHIEIVPSALKYEFNRSVGTPTESRDDVPWRWYDWAVVDSKVYLYFMQYLVYSHLNRHRDKLTAAENLWEMLQRDRNLGHRETGYNLLGWIYCQEGHILTAAYCFLQSWRIRPHHNAAKWHMLVLISQQTAAG